MTGQPTDPGRTGAGRNGLRQMAQGASEGLHIDPNHYSPIVSTSRLASLQYAVSGWLYMLRYQKNTRIQAVASLAVLIVGLWLRISALEWAIMTVTVSLVWMAEFVNAAIEATVNLASPELHPMAKIAKDVAAAAVLLGAVASVLVGVLIFGPPLLERLLGG